MFVLEPGCRFIPRVSDVETTKPRLLGRFVFADPPHVFKPGNVISTRGMDGLSFSWSLPLQEGVIER